MRLDKGYNAARNYLLRLLVFFSQIELEHGTISQKIYFRDSLSIERGNELLGILIRSQSSQSTSEKHSKKISTLSTSN